MWKLYGSSIFLDRNKLSPRYIPQTLPHREEQISLLKSFYEDSLADPSRTYLRVVQIIGGVGTGKTACTIRFGGSFKDEAVRRGFDVRHVYINLKLHGGSRVVLYRHLLEQGAPEIYSPSLSAEEILRQLARFLEDNGRHLLISLDEIDYFIRHTREHVVYDLTRLNELYPEKGCGVIGLIFTARSRRFHDQLDRAELSTLGRNYIDLNPYTSSQIVDILEHRVQEAFKPGAVSSEVLEYVADVTASPPVHGDIRYALDLLLYSGHLANQQGSKKILPEHVRKVHGETHHLITTEDIMNLPEKEKVVLLGIVRSLQGIGSPYVSLRDVRSFCGVVSEELGLKPIEDVEGYVQDLHDRGIVDIRSLTKIGISGVPTEDLFSFLDNIVERVRSGIR